MYECYLQSPNVSNAVGSVAVLDQRLVKLVDTLEPAELADHAQLSHVYEAARSIVKASENGWSNTSQLPDFPDRLAPLVRKYFDRYTDAMGNVTLPTPLYGSAPRDSVQLSSADLASYNLVRYLGANEGHKEVIFTRWPLELMVGE